MESSIRIFGASSCQTYESITVQHLKKPPEPIKGLNDGQNLDLMKVKLNKVSVPDSYDIFPHNCIIGVVPVIYGVFLHNFLLNVLFVYLISCFVPSNVWCCPKKNHGTI